jgi:hypothetical protein
MPADPVSAATGQPRRDDAALPAPTAPPPDGPSGPPPDRRTPAITPAPTAATIESWLTELGLDPPARAERDGAASWDLVLDGRRRFDLPITIIVDPGLGLVAWCHSAPPISDGFRRAYRTLLRWNDEFPFAKFGLAEDERPVLSVELRGDRLSADELGLAIARIVGIADQLLDETAGWLWIGGTAPKGDAERTPRHPAFLERYAARLPELFAS